jgi:hypothetical protein
MDINALDILTEKLLANDDGWKKVHDKKGVVVFTKRNVFGNITSIRYLAVIKQNIEIIDDFAYKRMLHFMPFWSKEFIKGEVLQSNPLDSNTQLLKTQFKTPFFLKNRSYVFNLYRIKSDNSLKVIYHSVVDKKYEAVEKGFIRSTLYPTVYKFTQLENGDTQVEHILSTDLGKDLPYWFQNAAPVVSGVVKANIRDCQNIKKVLEEMR